MFGFGKKKDDELNTVSVNVYIKNEGGKPEGPYDLTQLSEMYSCGKLSGGTYCSFNGNDWLLLKDLPLMNLIRNASEGAVGGVDDDDKEDEEFKAVEKEKDEEDEALLMALSQNDDYVDDDSPIITCPHCWKEFHLSQVNYFANHPTLVGDSVLGESAQMRFLPSKFNSQGYAIDS